MDELNLKRWDLRKNILDIVMAGKGGHIGGDMSVLETLITLYYLEMNVSPDRVTDPNRDRFVLSKGHSVEALYAVLADRGFLKLADIEANFSKFNSRYIGHPSNKLQGIEMNSGSLGHGLPICVGMALAGKMDERPYRVYTVMGDGELAEGSIWEAAMAATQYHLDNLCAVVDRNRLQISGSTEDVMGQDDLYERFSSFGWNVFDVENGNSIPCLYEAFEAAKSYKGKPSIIIANTVKGYGSVVMENKVVWHHKVPSAEEYLQIVEDFAKRKEQEIHE